jgi:uncharacterized protein (DUF427 family)
MPSDKFTTEPVSKTVKVTFNGTTIANSQETLLLREGSHAPVYYFPRSDVNFDVLTKTDHLTH